MTLTGLKEKLSEEGSQIQSYFGLRFWRFVEILFEEQMLSILEVIQAVQ